MNTDYVFWVAVAAYALHVLEEYTYDWKTWAQKILKLDVDWNTFHVTNVVMLFVGIACAEVGWSHPTFSLIFPAILIINALISHVLPYIRSKRKFSPGLFTAIFLFLPIGFGCFNTAMGLGVHTKSLILAGLCGAFLAVYPFFLVKTKNLDFFKP
ncbi:MAG TPA: HXXEE domain-containing protein [Mucilaginibacter sp.]|jgi:hypothetical protein|nr:HXXEE domain-containing protein [Mucilaginibacter sp.]